MRILLVHPGASWSTFDVWQGVNDALKHQGVEVIQYALDGRIERAKQYLSLAYNNHPDKSKVPQPTHEDVLWLASEEIVIRALQFKVDWVLVIACGWLHPNIFDLTRRAGIRVAILFTESPNEDEFQVPVAAKVDVCWTNERSSVARFAEVCEAHYWRHAINPERHRPHPLTPSPAAAGEGEREGEGEGETWDDRVQAHDVVFVGTGWNERVELLSAIDWEGLGIDLGLYGSWELVPGDISPLHKYIRFGITPNEMTAALYRRAKVSLNLHRTSKSYDKRGGSIEHAESINPRCYELAANGCFFVSDERDELREVFGDAVPTFRGPDDLQALMVYWLAHEDERKARAARLPALVAGQTFDARVSEMLTILSNH